MTTEIEIKQRLEKELSIATMVAEAFIYGTATEKELVEAWTSAKETMHKIKEEATI